MFIGRYYHTIEEKGRLSLPKNFRQTQTNWIVTRGLDGGLFLFPQEKFQEELEKLASRTLTKRSDRAFVRYMANDAYELAVDDNGRVLLPEYLKKFANLNKDVVVVGSYTYLEIWDVTKYHQYIDQIETDVEKIAEEIET
jgi:MraZ protein